MNYAQALNYFNETQKFGSRPGLKSIGTLMEYLDNPQKKLKFIHVAGTNGKGSTVSFISNILMDAGYKVGIYTSPYIQRFSERIRVNREEIPQNQIAQLTVVIKAAVDRMIREGFESPTEFDLMTAMAFLYFAEMQCNIVVLEAGLGGRLDSTNIIDSPEAAVITTVSYDHMDVLGNTLLAIAFEKAGIIKKGCDVVLYPQEPKINMIFDQKCRIEKANLHKVDFSTLKSVHFGQTGQIFDYKNYRLLEIGMLGKHQLGNAATAIDASEILQTKGYTISEENIRRGLAKTRWPGRMEIIHSSPLTLIDGAHNVQGVLSLKECLIKYFPGRKITFIVGVLADKEYEDMMDMIAPLAERFIAVTPKSPRALPAEELARLLARHGKPVSSFSSMEDAILDCSRDDMVCAFGSLYFIGKVRDIYGLR
jgi:dihydrofolate synthase/folylpolyglutamate synthase